jgi:hypothetical protein
MTIVQVKPARAKNSSGEIELLPPIGDDRTAEEPFRPVVHLGRDLLGRRHEDVRLRERQLQVPLIVERHAVDLAERIFAVEHPAVGAREHCVGHVANAFRCPRPRPRRRARTLNPLPLQVRGNLRAVEAAGPGIADRNLRAPDRRGRRQKVDPLAVVRALRAPFDARPHQCAAIVIQRRERVQRLERHRRQDIAVVFEQSITKSQLAGLLHQCLRTTG